MDHEPSYEERFSLIFDHIALAMACEKHFKSEEEQLQETGILTMADRTVLDTYAKEIQTTPEAYDSFHAPIEFRKFLFNYISGLPGNKVIKKNVSQTRTYSQLVTLLKDYEQHVYNHQD